MFVFSVVCSNLLSICFTCQGHIYVLYFICIAIALSFCSSYDYTHNMMSCSFVLAVFFISCPIIWTFKEIYIVYHIEYNYIFFWFIFHISMYIFTHYIFYHSMLYWKNWRTCLFKLLLYIFFLVLNYSNIITYEKKKKTIHTMRA